MPMQSAFSTVNDTMQSAFSTVNDTTQSACSSLNNIVTEEMTTTMQCAFSAVNGSSTRELATKTQSAFSFTNEMITKIVVNFIHVLYLQNVGDIMSSDLLNFKDAMNTENTTIKELFAFLLS